MRIIYGVSGEGSGHVFEAIEVASFLEQHGHTVKIFTYGNRAVAILEQYFDTTCIKGISLYFNSKGLSLPQTILKNTDCLSFYFKNSRRLRRDIKDFNPDIFITAYEPFTTLMSHFMHKPLISVDNQNDLLYVPKPNKASWFQFHLVRFATKICTYGATEYVIKSFRHDLKSRSNIHFVSPLIQKGILDLKSTNGSHILVYLTKPNDMFINTLRTIPEDFIVYCNTQTERRGNVTFKTSGPAFLADLSTCKAIMGTAGFSLINDAMYLKKPYFAVPLKKQFEQIYNAQFLESAGIGSYSENPTREDVETFLVNLDRYRDRLDQIDIRPFDQIKTILSLVEKHSLKL